MHSNNENYNRMKYNIASAVGIAIFVASWIANIGWYRFLFAIPMIIHAVIFFVSNNYYRKHCRGSDRLNALNHCVYISYVLFYILLPDGGDAPDSMRAVFGLVINEALIDIFGIAAGLLCIINIALIVIQLVHASGIKRLVVNPEAENVLQKRKLFLASYFTQVADLLPSFAGEELAGKKVLFIPTAALHEEDPFYVSSDRAALQNLGLIVEDLDISGMTYEVVERSLSDTDCVFVGGGNTFYLLQELRRTGADKLIARHIESGKLYIGTSAGSAILQKDIIADGTESLEIAPDLNGDYSALGIVDFYLYVHYGHNYYGDDDECIAKYYNELDLIKISDKQAVTVDGEAIEIIAAR